MSIRKQHKWLGIIVCLFLLIFTFSGIILNHRSMYGRVNIPRSWLPEDYQFRNFNGGLLKGTLALDDKNVVMYGKGGVYLTDKKASFFKDFNEGMSSESEARDVYNVVKTKSGKLFAVTRLNAYAYGKNGWERLLVGKHDSRVSGTNFTDVTVKGDSVIFVGKNELYLSLPPYKSFTQITLKPYQGYTPEVSVFSLLWSLHSGIIIGLPGKILLDLIGLVIIFLCFTAIIVFLMPHVGKVIKIKFFPKMVKWSMKWHSKVGKLTIIVLLFTTVTGFILSPIFKSALSQMSSKPIPFSKHDTDNAWYDKLCALRWDDANSDWLICSTAGFYSMKSLDATPVAVPSSPAVDVKGVTVLRAAGENAAEGSCWMIGSESGLQKWNRQTGEVSVMKETAVSGYTPDFGKEIVVEKESGTALLAQPEWMSKLPMSMWQVAQEFHTGRLFATIGLQPYVYIPLASFFVIWILLTGWFIRIRKK